MRPIHQANCASRRSAGRAHREHPPCVRLRPARSRIVFRVRQSVAMSEMSVDRPTPRRCLRASPAARVARRHRRRRHASGARRVPVPSAAACSGCARRRPGSDTATGRDRRYRFPQGAIEVRIRRAVRDLADEYRTARRRRSAADRHHPRAVPASASAREQREGPRRRRPAAGTGVSRDLALGRSTTRRAWRRSSSSSPTDGSVGRVLLQRPLDDRSIARRQRGLRRRGWAGGRPAIAAAISASVSPRKAGVPVAM